MMGRGRQFRLMGLMSAAALVDAYGCSDADRAALLRTRRPQSVPLERGGTTGERAPRPEADERRRAVRLPPGRDHTGGVV